MIVYDEKPRPVAPTVTAVAGQASVGLSPSARFVRPGTPLRLGPGGWLPALDGYGELVAVDGKWGGDLIGVARLAVVNYNRHLFPEAPCRLRVRDIDDSGNVSFETSESGPYLALNPTTVLMDMTAVAVHGILARMAQKLADLARQVEGSPPSGE